MRANIRHTGEQEGIWTGYEMGQGHSLCEHPTAEDLRELREMREKLEKLRERVSSLWEISKKIREDREIQRQIQSILSRMDT